MKKVFKFNSGLTLLYSKNKINKSTVLDISFGCGARCDGDLAGLSHFCEHMFFTGTRQLDKQAVTKRYYDFIKVNAYTDTKTITFTGSIFTNKLPDYLSVVADMICNSKFGKAEVEEEKKVVIQEIVRDKDNVKRRAGALFDYQLYGLEASKNRVLGNEQSVMKITPKDVKSYVKKYFVKNNCTIYISTPLSFNKTKNIIKKYFEQVIPLSNMEALPYNIEEFQHESMVLDTQKIDKNYVKMAFIFDSQEDRFRHRCILNLLSNMIDDFGEGIMKVLRLEKNLVYSIGVNYTHLKDKSALIISTETSSENVKPYIDGVAEYLNNIRKHGFTQEQLDKKLTSDRYFWDARIDTPDNDVDDLYRYTFYGKFFEDKLIHTTTQSITLEEVNTAFKEIFANPRIISMVYGNATKKDVYTLKQIKKKFDI